MSEPTMTPAELTELRDYYRREAERAFADAEAKRDAELSRLQSENERLKSRWHMRQANCTLNGDMACGELKDTRVMLEVAIEQRRAAEAERDRAREVVRELVRLKDLHDKIGAIPYDYRGPDDWKLLEEYHHSNPLAWQAARLLSEKGSK